MLYYITLFALQHSIMARERFKKFILKFIPKEIERAVYVFLSGVIFIIIVLFYRPIDGVIWKFDSIVATILWGLYIFGWLFSLISTFIIDHFELFGIKQSLQNSKSENEFKEVLFYKYVRHPIQLGVLIALWATPIMNLGHFILSLLLTIYIFIGLYFEEKSLVKEFGKVYTDYKKRVPMIFPKIFN